jgi:AcrR family transcriptional regulator
LFDDCSHYCVSERARQGAERYSSAAVPDLKKQRAAPQHFGGGRRQQNKLEKFERIRAAAYTLFLERGVEHTTLSEVAERAGVAKGTLFLYAADKADLICLVLHDRLSRAVDGALSSLPRNAPLITQLMHLFRALFAMYGEHPDLSRAFVGAYPSARGPNATRLAGLSFAFLASLAELVRAAGERGELAPDVPASQAASNVFALYFAALMAWVSGLASLEAALDPMLEQALLLQIRGLLQAEAILHYPPRP